jgi:hypothetical protein
LSLVPSFKTIAFVPSIPTTIPVLPSNLPFKTRKRFPTEKNFLDSCALSGISSFNASCFGKIRIESPSIPTIVPCKLINSPSQTST